jgi:hypothetical protein
LPHEISALWGGKNLMRLLVIAGLDPAIQAAPKIYGRRKNSGDDGRVTSLGSSPYVDTGQRAAAVELV